MGCGEFKLEFWLRKSPGFHPKIDDFCPKIGNFGCFSALKRRNIIRGDQHRRFTVFYSRNQPNNRTFWVILSQKWLFLVQNGHFGAPESTHYSHCWNLWIRRWILCGNKGIFIMLTTVVSQKLYHGKSEGDFPCILHYSDYE